MISSSSSSSSSGSSGSSVVVVVAVDLFICFRAHAGPGAEESPL